MCDSRSAAVLCHDCAGRDDERPLLPCFGRCELCLSLCKGRRVIGCAEAEHAVPRPWGSDLAIWLWLRMVTSTCNLCERANLSRFQHFRTFTPKQ